MSEQDKGNFSTRINKDKQPGDSKPVYEGRFTVPGTGEEYGFSLFLGVDKEGGNTSPSGTRRRVKRERPSTEPRRLKFCQRPFATTRYPKERTWSVTAYLSPIADRSRTAFVYVRRLPSSQTGMAAMIRCLPSVG